MRGRNTLAAFAVLALVATAAAAQETTQASPLPFRLTGSLGLVTFAVNGAYFGSSTQPGGAADNTYLWAETVGRVRLESDITDSISAALSFTGVLTQGTDYYGLKDGDHHLVDTAFVAFKKLGGSGFDIALGRQDIEIGDGFIIGDGYYDNHAAFWSIPLNFWDALRVDYSGGAAHVTGMFANLSNSYGPQEGSLFGLDLAWTPAGAGTLALCYFGRNDSGLTDNDARIASLRGSVKLGSVTLAGEYGSESGKRQEVDLAGEAYHFDIAFTLSEERGTYVKGSYLHFSGDDPKTSDNEQYFPWNYRWHDWSQYYMGDIVGSQMLFNVDENVIRLEFGTKPSETTRVRLFLQNFRLDTGSYFGGLPEGVGKNFANELNLVFDYAPRPNFSLWVLVGYAQPKDAGKALFGDKDIAEILTSFSVTF